MKRIDPAALRRRWVHSHEEDTEGERVFRPASFAFPPSRGRSAFELRADGSFAESAPGPTDRPEETEGGRWKLEGDRDMHLVIADPAQPTRTMIVEVPSTTCDHVCSSGHVAQFRFARAALIAKFGTPTSSFHRFATPPPITVTGVGFFDFLHGQTGVAPNGVELHPVLKVAL